MAFRIRSARRPNPPPSSSPQLLFRRGPAWSSPPCQTDVSEPSPFNVTLDVMGPQGDTVAWARNWDFPCTQKICLPAALQHHPQGNDPYPLSLCVLSSYACFRPVPPPNCQISARWRAHLERKRLNWSAFRPKTLWPWQPVPVRRTSSPVQIHTRSLQHLGCAGLIKNESSALTQLAQDTLQVRSVPR